MGRTGNTRAMTDLAHRGGNSRAASARVRAAEALTCCIRATLLVALAYASLFVAQPVRASANWVGEMIPRAGHGSPAEVVEGAPFSVSVQVWKADVTPGPGASIACLLHWGQVEVFGAAWTAITDTPMQYVADAGDNDVHQAEITPPPGRYEFTVRCVDSSDNDVTWQQDGNGQVTVLPTLHGLAERRALWLNQQTIAWHGQAGETYRLLFDPDGGMDLDAAASSPWREATIPGHLPLEANGLIDAAAYPKNPNADGLVRLRLPAETPRDVVAALLRGQLAVAAYDATGRRVDAAGVQVQGVLDDLYARAAAGTVLGPSYDQGVPSVQLWAPTAQSVTLLRYADAVASQADEHAMAFDPATGIWSVMGDSTWDRQFYRFAVIVYVPETDAVERNVVTDPYATSLSADGPAAGDVRSQFVNLDDADLKPAGWESLVKPSLAAPEAIVLYEMHVRDFSINDPTVPQAQRGTFMAFTQAESAGMQHLSALADAGLTHVQLLPAFDFATVPETDVARAVDPAPAGLPAASNRQQARVDATRTADGFNWGYDPVHFGAPEGSYSTDPQGVARIREFREMVQALSQHGLRTVMDVVYNHTYAHGQADKSVLDQIVPGYYHRYTLDGALAQSSCCPDTASEYAMMEKLMVDTLARWATAYKVDGFRFDLMNLHTRRNMTTIQDALRAIDPDIYLYGEGWDFGSAAAKGLTACPDCYAAQGNMAGAGIGLFNDRLRDAAHGGYSQDPLQVRAQGFTNGLHTDWNGYCYANRDEAALHRAMDTLRSALRASGVDWNGQGAPFTADPQESVPYVAKHDNETLYDQNVFKLPHGPGDPGQCGSDDAPSVTSMEDRVRVQNLGLSLVGLSQGVPFFHMGSERLRSKSLDRNSYDSGDWFNRVFWDGSSNNFGVGLPPARENSLRWPIMEPLLADAALVPAPSDMARGAAHLREILRIRSSSPLFRLTSEDAINARVGFLNADNDPDALLVMTLDDTAGENLDPNWARILVFFNAHPSPQRFAIPELRGNASVQLHPVLADAVDADAAVQTATFDPASGRFTLPARTTAVFVVAQAEPPSTLAWVGQMRPAGGIAFPIRQGAFKPPGFDVVVQVFAGRDLDDVDAEAAIECALHWGRTGEIWQDTPMVFDGRVGDNLAYRATLTRAMLNALAPGSYGYTVFCRRQGEEGRRWRDDDEGDGLLTVLPAADNAALAPPGGVFVHLFEWPWPDIEKECVFLAAAGYQAVQVSPPMEHIVPMADMGGPDADYPWWARYQPVTHDATKLESRSGTRAEFRRMVDACAALGVDIYVDAVINHTTGVGTGVGTAGSTYAPYRYPQYDPVDFHACGTADNDIQSYRIRRQVQTCELLNLADLDTSRPQVRAVLHAYLQDLLDMGVAGFRIDAAKHMAASDIESILAGLTRPDGSPPYIFQEVIEAGNEPVKGFEYAPHGDVTEFRYSVELGRVFNCGGQLASLRTLGDGLLDSDQAVVFTDNHDNQRGHGGGGACVLDHRDGMARYDLGNIFMLAHSYGYPKVMSSYYWRADPGGNAGDSKGPPSAEPPHHAGSGGVTRPVYAPEQQAGDVPANCAATFEDGKWVCEHRRPAMANMVAFRQVSAGEPVVHWWDDGQNQIAFGRSDRGFVAINGSDEVMRQTLQTGMAPGRYCDVTQGELMPGGQACPGRSVQVDDEGRIRDLRLGPMDALAIHAQAMLRVATFTVTLAASPSGLVIGQPVKLTAQVTPPRADVILDFEVVMGRGTLSNGRAHTDAAGRAVVAYRPPVGIDWVAIRAALPSAKMDGGDVVGETDLVYLLVVPARSGDRR